MKVSCPACDSKYTIADEKVAGRKVKVRCKSCGGQILINGTIPPPAPDPASESADASGAEASSGSDNRAGSTRAPATTDAKSKDEKRTAGATSALKMSPGVAAHSEPTSSPPASVDDGLVWSVNVTESDERSLSTSEVVEGYLSGEFAGEVYVWHDGLTDWSLIPDVPLLAQAIEAARNKSSPKTAESPAEPAALPKQKALPALVKGGKTTTTDPGGSAKKTAARAAGAKRPDNAHDLFAAASTAGSELDVAISDDDGTAAGSPKMTGARNENSVLFSLDALKAGIVSSPNPVQTQKAGSGRKAPVVPRKKLEDLMGDAALPLATGPAATTLLAANQALLTAPAPPPPKPKPEPAPPVPAAAVVAAAAGVYASQQRKKGLVMGFLGAIVAVGAVAGIAIAMTRSKPEPAPVASAKPVASPVVPAAAAPEPTKPAEPASAPTEAGSAAASASAPTTPAAAPQKAVAVAMGPKSGGTTGSVAAGSGKSEPKSEPKKEPKKEEPSGPVSSGVAGFNKDSASQALAVAASQTSICKKPDGPTGQGKVQVTFAPSGRATTANIVAGPFGGTAVGGCVSGVFKRARVPPFAGDPVTVSKSFSIVP